MDNYDSIYSEKYRIAIYLFWDKTGDVDRYVLYYLQALREVANEIIVVCNGELSDKGRELLDGVCDIVHQRENVGYDGWAYKDVIDNVIGWDKLRNIDELIITNNTLYGPIVPFSKMFSDMDESNADFWGAQKRFEDKSARTFLGKPTVHGYIPDFPPSNFWVIRKKALLSKEFKNFWDTLAPLDSYEDSCIYCEPVFAKDLVDAGLVMDTYMGDERRFSCISPTEGDTFYQVTQEHIPVVRRKTFFNPLSSYIRIDGADNAAKTMDYIRNNTYYDSSMIYENLCRTANLADLRDRLQLNYVISAEHLTGTAEKKRIALIYYCENEKKINNLGKYLGSFPNNTKFFFVAASEYIGRKAETYFSNSAIKNKEIIVSESPAGWVNVLVSVSRHIILDGSFDYICFAKDVTIENNKWTKTEEALEDRCFNAVMGSSAQIDGIIDLFDKNPNMGAISSLPPNHANFFSSTGGSWGKYFNETKALSEKLGLTVSITSQKRPVYPPCGIFWFRPDSIKRLMHIDIIPEEFAENELLIHAYEFIIYYVMQECGYYPAAVISDESARYEITNLTYMLGGINSILIKKFKTISNYEHLLFRLRQIDAKRQSIPMSNFAGKNNKQANALAADSCFGFYSHDEVNLILDKAPMSLLIKKMIKRFVPRSLWNWLRTQKRKS